MTSIRCAHDPSGSEQVLRRCGHHRGGGSFNERRWDDFAAAYREDATIEYPQSGERIVGHENILGLVARRPNDDGVSPALCAPGCVLRLDASH